MQRKSLKKHQIHLGLIFLDICLTKFYLFPIFIFLVLFFWKVGEDFVVAKIPQQLFSFFWLLKFIFHDFPDTAESMLVWWKILFLLSLAQCKKLFPSGLPQFTMLYPHSLAKCEILFPTRICFRDPELNFLLNSKLFKQGHKILFSKFPGFSQTFPDQIRSTFLWTASRAPKSAWEFQCLCRRGILITTEGQFWCIWAKIENFTDYATIFPHKSG